MTKKARRINVSIPGNVVDELNVCGPVNKSKLVTEALQNEIERIKREGETKAVIHILNFCDVPIVLTSDDGASIRLEPQKSTALPRQKPGVMILGSKDMADTMRESGRTDVWPA